MKKFFGIKIPSKKELTEEDFVKAAEVCGCNKLIGMKLREALMVYAPNAKITQAFLYRIPDEEIETIKGIKATGHKIINYMKEI